MSAFRFRCRWALIGLVWMVSSPAGGFGAEKAPPTSAPPSSSQPGEKNTKKPAPKKEDALREIRIGASLETPRSETPDEPGKPNIARQIFLRVTLQMALDAHKGEWAPLFQSERTKRGLRKRGAHSPLCASRAICSVT